MPKHKEEQIKAVSPFEKEKEVPQKKGRSGTWLFISVLLLAVIALAYWQLKTEPADEFSDQEQSTKLEFEDLSPVETAADSTPEIPRVVEEPTPGSVEPEISPAETVPEVVAPVPKVNPVEPVEEDAVAPVPKINPVEPVEEVLIPVPEVSPEDPEMAKQRETALDARAEFDFKHNSWLDRSAEKWSLSAFADAEKIAIAAGEALEAKSYIEAAEAYLKALVTLEMLETEIPEATNQQLRKAQLAIENGKKADAEESLRLISILNPDHAFAEKLKVRAAVCEEVFALITTAKENEAASEWGLAMVDYQQAYQMDTASANALEGLNRTKKHIAGKSFDEAMSEGFKAYSKTNYVAAVTAFSRAVSIRNIKESKAALLQAENALRLKRLAAKEKAALALEEAERWESALVIYEEVLAEDISIAFAREGKKRVVQQAEFLKAVESLLAKPDRLLTDKGFDYAKSLVEEYASVELKSKTLKLKMQELENAMVDASTPIQLFISSDGKTSVDVYRVGRFGELTQKVLKLKPGKYTIVGHREGYRDVRKEIFLEPGSDFSETEIICDEKL